MSHHDLLTMTLPLEYMPGNDKMSRTVLKHQDIADLITKELLDAPNDTYTLADGDWNDARCDVLYMSNPPSLFPPVLIEVQNTINDLSLQRLVTYSLNVVKTYHALPVVLVFGINKISPASLSLDFNVESDQKPWLLTIPSLIWAKNCFIISKETIPDNDYHSCPMNPLLGLSLFLLEQQPSLHRHTYSKDPTVSYFIKSRSRNYTFRKHTNKIFSRLWKRYAQRTSAYFKVFLKRLSQRNRSTRFNEFVKKAYSTMMKSRTKLRIIRNLHCHRLNWISLNVYPWDHDQSEDMQWRTKTLNLLNNSKKNKVVV